MPVTTTEDTEITLGTGKMLALFFGLVALCAVFFGMGFKVGKSSAATASVDSSGALVSGASHPSAAKPAATPANAPAPSLSFYKSVEQPSPTPQLTTPADVNNPQDVNTVPVANTSAPAQAAPAAVDQATPPPPPNGFFVQVAAVSKQEDADALVEALKKKQYPAFSTVGSTDTLFHIQLGPYADIKQAEDIRTRLTNDGYNPILKK